MAWQRSFKFGPQEESDLTISADGRVATKASGSSYGWTAAFLEPEFSTAGQTYQEFVIEEVGFEYHALIGVTSLEAAPAPSTHVHMSPKSSLFYCGDSKAYPGSRLWGPSKQLQKDDKLGLLVDRGSLYIRLNGQPLEQQPMTARLPSRVRFVVELRSKGSSVRLA